MAIESLPAFCMKNCVAKWEEALKTQAGDLDDYTASTEDCKHLPVVFSHEALQSTDSSSKRIYSIVDMCEDCLVELQENVYTFDCPYN